MTLSKVDVARRQLGLALDLFIEDIDPVSVHSLASSGGEIVEDLLISAQSEPFVTHAMKGISNRKIQRWRGIRNRYWNAFKHATKPKSEERETLNSFSDFKNDHSLFVGWYDFMLLEGRLPVEAQVFQIWYFSLYPNKLDEGVEMDAFEKVFPDIKLADRSEQKRRLKSESTTAKGDYELMSHIKTDPSPLVLGGLR